MKVINKLVDPLLQQTRIKWLSIAFIAISLIIAPLSTVILGFLFLLVFRKRIEKWIANIILILTASIILLLFSAGVNMPEDSFAKWVLVVWDWRSLLAVSVTAVWINKHEYILKTTAETMLDEVIAEEQDAIPTGTINPSNPGNLLVVGTTRSGKTVEMLHEIEYACKQGMFTFIISGKNGTHDDYGMRQITEKLCAKYNVPFYLVSTSAQECHSKRINPFEDCDSETVVDIITTVSPISEEHYKVNFCQWLKIICTFLTMIGEQINIYRILELYDYKDFVSKVNASPLADDQKRKLAKDGRSCSTIAADSRARIADLIEGRGEDIIGLDDDISISRARCENAVLMLDLDGLGAPDLSERTATLCLGALANIIANEAKETIRDRKLIILDELSIFFCKYIPRIYGLASGYGYKTISGTQSFSDLDKISPFLKKETVENSQQFIFLLQNEPEDAEYAASITGTKHAIEMTKKVEGIDYTEAGMQKVVKEYKVHPDQIKEQRPCEGFYYQKLPKPRLVKFKLDYVNTDICIDDHNPKRKRKKPKKIS